MKKIIKYNIETIDAAKELFANSTKIVEFNNNNNFNSINKNLYYNNLYFEEFPEYWANYTPFATNTGLMCFYKQENKQLVIYDITQNDTKESIDTIAPDVSYFDSYSFFENPLTVRRVRFQNNKFIPETSYNNGEKEYCYLNCDKLKGTNTDILPNQNNNYYFECSKNNITEIIYSFKPNLCIYLFNNAGNKLINNDYSININGKKMNHNSDSNKYFYDCSMLIEGSTGFPDLTISFDTSNILLEGYLEVL